ncbi:MAG: hypothetical protein AB1439_10615 [candidate division FCPU426 bacterium]
MTRAAVFHICLLGLALAFSRPGLALDVRFGDPAGTTPAASSALLPPLTCKLQTLTPKPRQGEPVQFSLTLQLQPGVVADSGTTLTSLGEWEVLGVERGPAQDQEEKRVRQDRLTLVTFASGKVEVPAWIQTFRLADGQPGEFRTAPLTVNVEPVPHHSGDRPGEIRGLKPQRGLFVAWPWLLAAALASLAVAAGWWWSQRQKPGALPFAAPSRPPAEVAREQLERLRQADWPGQGNFKAYYVELSAILRLYVEGCFQVPALDQTTPELLKALKHARAKLPDINASREVLNRSDLVKFAKWLPTAAEAQADWQAVWDMVERTEPKPEPAEEPHAAG